MDDRARRRKLAALSFTEKIRILEKLRARSLAIAAAGLRPDKLKTATKPQRPSK